MNYRVYQGIENKRKAYVAVSAEIHPDDALRIANQHFKTNLFGLRIEAGYVKGKNLYLGYPEEKRTNPVWVVTKKGR